MSQSVHAYCTCQSQIDGVKKKIVEIREGRGDLKKKKVVGKEGGDGGF